MSDDDEKIIIGAPRRGLPLWVIEMGYIPGSKPLLASICDHEVILAPAGQQAYATGEYGLICSDCVESYSIIRGGTNEHAPLPGAVEEMEASLGKEEAHRIIEDARPELERRVGMRMNLEEEK